MGFNSGFKGLMLCILCFMHITKEELRFKDTDVHGIIKRHNKYTNQNYSVRKCLFVTWLWVLAWIRRLFLGLSPLRSGHFGFGVNTVACVEIQMDSQKEVKWIPNRSLFLIRQLVIVNDTLKEDCCILPLQTLHLFEL